MNQVIAKYKALKTDNTEYRIYSPDDSEVYYPQYHEKNETHWHMFKDDKTDKWIQSKNLASIENFLSNFAFSWQYA